MQKCQLSKELSRQKCQLSKEVSRQSHGKRRLKLGVGDLECVPLLPECNDITEAQTLQGDCVMFQRQEQARTDLQAIPDLD